jgi:hypothetical protein
VKYSAEYVERTIFPERFEHCKSKCACAGCDRPKAPNSDFCEQKHFATQPGTVYATLNNVRAVDD